MLRCIAAPVGAVCAHRAPISSVARAAAPLRPVASRVVSRPRRPAEQLRQPTTPALQPSPATPHSKQLAAASATAATAALLAWPCPALAAQSADQAHSMYLLSVFVGLAFTTLTLLSTSRFIMSFFPRLMTKAHKRRLPWALFTLCDPMLRPLQQGLFRMEPTDLHYGAVALLGAATTALELLVGQDGLLVGQVPDPSLLHYLQYLVFFQHGLLLPTWTLVVLRAFYII